MRFGDRMKLFCVVLDRLEWIEWNRIGFRKNDGWWKCDYLCFLYKSYLYKYANFKFLTIHSFNELSIYMELACSVLATVYLDYL